MTRIRERHNAYMRDYYRKHKDKIYLRNRRALAKNGDSWPSETRERRREYEKRCIAKRRLSPTKWARHLMLSHAARKRAYTKLKGEVFTYYGNKCACCGIEIFEFLTMDHVNNDGSSRRKTGEPTGLPLYRLIKKLGFPKDFQILCWNCNEAKHHHGVCPHQKGKGDNAKI